MEFKKLIPRNNFDRAVVALGIAGGAATISYGVITYNPMAIGAGAGTILATLYGGLAFGYYENSNENLHG